MKHASEMAFGWPLVVRLVFLLNSTCEKMLPFAIYYIFVGTE